MKKNIATMMLLMTANISSTATAEDKNSSGPTRIEMDITNTSSNEYERSIDIPIIEAIFYSNIAEVEVLLHNIGNATISLVNADGEVVDSAEVDTSIPSTVTLQVDGSSNTYYIVVTSPKIYAEGSFEI